MSTHGGSPTSSASSNRTNGGGRRDDSLPSFDGRTRLMTVVIVVLVLVLGTVTVDVKYLGAVVVDIAWTIEEGAIPTSSRTSNESTYDPSPSHHHHHSTTTATNNNNNNNHNLYLLYFSQGGWANQVACLKNAYLMAYILNRILLLPPVLPHRNEPGSTKASMVLGPTGHGFHHQHKNNETDPFYHYLHRLPPDRYLPISHVLDIPLTLPGVQTMDVRDFYQTYYHPTKMTKTTIESDLDYSHFNTVWLYNAPSELEGRIDSFKRNEHGRLKSLNQTYRDLGRTLGSKSEDILVFLDSYRSDMHETIFVQLPPWQPIMTPAIRQTIRSAVADWPSYAAIHLRAGDGQFKLRIYETIRHVLQGIAVVILEWLTNNITQPPPPTIGLYIATDLENFRTHKLFAAEIANLTTVLLQQHQVHLSLLSLADLGSTTIGGIATTASAAPLSLLGGMLYEDLYCDIQVAVCAPIGFYGSDGSTLSQLIALHRDRLVTDHAC